MVMYAETWTTVGSIQRRGENPPIRSRTWTPKNHLSGGHTCADHGGNCCTNGCPNLPKPTRSAVPHRLFSVNTSSRPTRRLFLASAWSEERRKALSALLRTSPSLRFQSGNERSVLKVAATTFLKREGFFLCVIFFRRQFHTLSDKH